MKHLRVSEQTELGEVRDRAPLDEVFVLDVDGEQFLARAFIFEHVAGGPEPEPWEPIGFRP